MTRVAHSQIVDRAEEHEEDSHTRSEAKLRSRERSGREILLPRSRQKRRTQPEDIVVAFRLPADPYPPESTGDYNLAKRALTFGNSFPRIPPPSLLPSLSLSLARATREIVSALTARRTRRTRRTPSLGSARNPPFTADFAAAEGLPGVDIAAQRRAITRESARVPR